MWIQSNDDWIGPGADLEAIAALPQVESVANGKILFAKITTPAGRVFDFGEVSPIASGDGRWGGGLDHWTVLEGRRSNPARVHEVVLGFDEAQRLGVHVGDRLDLAIPTTDGFFAAYADSLPRLPDAAAGSAEVNFDDGLAMRGGLRFRGEVVGIVAMPGAVPPFSGSITGAVHLTPAFHARYADGLSSAGLLAVRIRPGSSLASFKAAVEDLGSEALFLTSRPTQTKAVDRSLALQANVLWLIGGVALFVVLLLLAQALSRMTTAESGDFPVLRALGMTQRQLWLVGLGRACAIAVPAAVLCCITAAGLSVFWPAGLAGTIEPSPGFAVDAPVVVGGAVLVVAIVMLFAAWPAWRVANRAGRRRAKVGSSSMAARIGIGRPAFSARIGARLILEPGACGTRCPGADCDRGGGNRDRGDHDDDRLQLEPRPPARHPEPLRLDVGRQVGSRGLPDVSGPLIAGLRANPAVREISAGTISNVSVDGVRVDALALERVTGGIGPRLLAGRASRSDAEIVLGSTTMRDLGLDIGDEVGVGVGDQSTSMRVVGRAVFPNFGDAGQLGRGAALPLAALGALGGAPTRNIVLVRFAPERPSEDAFRRLTSALAPYPVLGPERPDDLVSLGDVDGLAVALGLALAALAAATLGHTLIAAARTRCDRPRGAEGARRDPSSGRRDRRLAGDRARRGGDCDRDPDRHRGRPPRCGVRSRRASECPPSPPPTSSRSASSRRRSWPLRCVAAGSPAFIAARTRAARALRQE